MSDEINSDNLNDILKDLGKTYRKLGGKACPAEITIVGGAAVLAMYDFRESSMDIDAIIRAGGALKDAARIVGDKYNLEYEWLNSDFENTDSFSTVIRQHSRHYRTFSNVLDVRIVEPEYLLAMKVRSGREYKTDMSDIVGIIMEERKSGRDLSFGDIEKVFEEMYPGEDIPQESAIVMREAFASKSIEEMKLLYKRIVSEEKEMRSMVKSFEEKYPGVLNQDNAKTVLAKLSDLRKKNQETERPRISDIQKKLDSFGEKVESNKQAKNRADNIKQKGDDGAR